MGKVVTNTGETAREWGIVYKKIVQSMLLYGSKSWVAMGDMLKLLDLFYHRADRRIAVIMAQNMTSGEWEWTPVADAL